MIITVTCEVCGLTSQKKRSPATIKSAPRFCGQVCNGKARRGTGKGPRPTHKFECLECGEVAIVYRSPSASEPRYCSLACHGKANRGSANPAFSGGRHIDCNGYAHLLRPDHPHADCRGYVYEHRIVMEEKLGRFLEPSEVVHHHDRDKLHNDPKNLEVFPSQSEHMAHHVENRDVF